MRLFIAIQFDENILDALMDFQADLKSQGVTGNYTKRENLHITLAFILKSRHFIPRIMSGQVHSSAHRAYVVY